MQFSIHKNPYTAIYYSNIEIHEMCFVYCHPVIKNGGSIGDAGESKKNFWCGTHTNFSYRALQ